MATKSPRQFHSQWPNVASAAQLPNVSGATIQDAALEVGDIAFVTGGDMYVCIDDTLGAAVWQIIGTATGSRDRRAPSIIVGNGPAGDTLNDCDYVDPGDCSGIVSALAAAAVLGAPLDVYIRAGDYDADAGSVSLPLLVRNGVTVRGAGIGNTVIKGPSKDNGGGFSQNIFSLDTSSDLRDLSISLPPPDTDAATDLYVVSFDGGQAIAQNVQVILSGTWDATAIGFTGLQGCFGQSLLSGFPGASKVLDCLCGSLSSPLPSFIDQGGVPIVNGLAAVVGGPLSGGPDYGGIIVERLISWGGDHGIVLNGELAQVHDCVVKNPYLYGCWVLGNNNHVDSSKFIQLAMQGTERGILVEGANHQITNNNLYNYSPSGLGTAIELISNTQGNIVKGNRAGDLGQWALGISLASGSDNNTVIANNMSTAVTGYSDLGANNDLAHNK
jgi:hypothetical protein